MDDSRVSGPDPDEITSWIQRWVSILNPSSASFEDVVKPRLAEAHALVWRRESKRREG